MKGIVLQETDNIELSTDVRIEKGLGSRDVLFEIKVAGVCGSDAALAKGKYGLPTPILMGHEGAGVVKAVGDAVTFCEMGDHAILSTLANCGHCEVCVTGNPTLCGNPLDMLSQPYSLNGEPLYQFAQTSCFAELTIVKEHQVIPISKDVPLESAALVGCGVITGVGSVFNRAKVRPGDTCAVVGAGGVGLNVIQACHISGASRIVVFDLAPEKQAIATDFGATDFIASEGMDEKEMVEALNELVPGGVDHSFEVVGVNELVATCINMTKNGGNIVAVGVPPLGSAASIELFSLYQNKNLLGCRYGGARPGADFKMIIDLYLSGKLKLDELVTNKFKLDDYKKAFKLLESGSDARSVLTF